MSRAPRGRPAASGLTYRHAGVDIDGKARLLTDLTPTIASTHTHAVAAEMGAFAGALRLHPTDGGFLVATVDGVGTKTLIARQLDRDGVIGSDIVAHCANDLVATGAHPVAFLDYIAMARLVPSLVGVLIEAMSEACRALGIPLIGGETAEMPGVYAGEAYDVVGTMMGLAAPNGLITGASIVAGDRVIGLASSGLHTNGYSLARRVVDDAGARLRDHISELGATLGDALLAPHRCYAPAVLALLGQSRLHGLAHITGGGLVDNLTRVLPERCRARLKSGWPQPAIFAWLQRTGRIPGADMIKTFNLGIGMVVVVAAGDAAPVTRHFTRAGIPAFDIGDIVEGLQGVDLE
ncbi:MAG: phosphoribosylformylglycinamidine cyclo-ligase [Armatimonadota bacterium]